MLEWTRSDDRQEGIATLKTRRQFLNDMQKIVSVTSDKSCIYSEFSMMVTAHTQRVALASPWKTLGELDSSQLKCHYYYMIPSALPGTSIDDVEKFGSSHKELFRSVAPYKQEGEQVLAVFFALQPALEQSRVD